MTIYRKGKFQVKIANNGAIKVMPGDWLSKYSAAIHNDFLHVYEYGRKDKLGNIKTIPRSKVDLIFAGEILYHIPTHEKWVGTKKKKGTSKTELDSDGNLSLMTPEQKKKHIEELLKNDFNLSGAHLELVSKALGYLDKLDNALTIAEIFGLIGEGGILSVIGTSATMASVILFPLGMSISIVNVSEVNMKMAGMRAVAYATTSWSFNSGLPPVTSEVIDNISTTYERNRAKKAWGDALKETIIVLEKEVTKRNVKKSSFQAVLKALGDGKEQLLCHNILRSFEGKLRGTPLITWKRNYNIKYPN